MALIYSSFSQNQKRALPQLEQEYANLTQYFLSQKVKEVVDYLPIYGYTVDQLTGDLIAKQDKLKLFHFSGHSDAGGLDFAGADFQKEHVSNFFNTLNAEKVKLECIFLNGCDNVEIVRRLSEVPVVIGTRSPILDKDAFQFTSNFFRALISGKSSYKNAFDQACQALPLAQQERVSAIRGIDLRQDNDLPDINDYFISVNDDKIAKRGFPLGKSTGRRILSRVQYLAILITLIVAAVVFMSWDTILYYTRGYCCPDWDDREKCSILVAGFNGERTNQFINDGINGNVTYEKYLEAYYKNDLNAFINNNSIRKEEFPGKCGFDFLMTGAVDETETLTRINIETYPITGITQRIERITILGNLFDFRDSIQSITDIHQDQFVVSKICISCAKDHPGLRPIADAEIQKLESAEELATVYQDLNEEMAAIYLEADDLPLAVNSLQRVAFKDINDKTLAALELASELQIILREFQPAYETQTRYIESVQARQVDPERYELQATPETYEMARRELMLRRALLVLEQDGVFNRIQEQQALEDLQFLQLQQDDPGLYQEEINQLCERLGFICDNAQNNPVDLKIRSRHDGAVIPGAEAVYADAVYRADDRGIITIPCFREDCIGQEVEVSARGYQSRGETIRRVADGQTIYLGAIPENQVELRGMVIHPEGKPIPGALVELGNKRVKTAGNGNFSLGAYPESNLPDGPIIISREGYEGRQIGVEELLNSFEVVLEPIPVPGGNERAYTIYGTVRDCDFPNTNSRFIYINKDPVPVNPNNGGYAYEISGKPGDRVRITPPAGLKFQNSDIGLVDLGQDQEMERNLILEEARPERYTITGRIVYNEDPIPGASVVLKGTSIGTLTNFEGKFELIVDGYFCQVLMPVINSNNRREIPLRDFKPDGKTISMGDIDVR